MSPAEANCHRIIQLPDKNIHTKTKEDLHNLFESYILKVHKLHWENIPYTDDLQTKNRH